MQQSFARRLYTKISAYQKEQIDPDHSKTIDQTKTTQKQSAEKREIMWKNQITQNNIQSLRNYGFHVINPGCGFQACGGEGEGRMAEPHYIADFLDKFFNDKPLKGKKVIITAGPTVEPIDPVRYISNHSSGKHQVPPLACSCME